MIRSKIDAIKEERSNACKCLEAALATHRGTTDARQDAYERRKAASETLTCQCCGAPIKQLVGNNGACPLCDASIKRMLAFKSHIRDNWPTAKRISRFIDDYSTMPNPPYALRGNSKDEYPLDHRRKEILVAAEWLLEATMKLDTAKKLEDTKRKVDDVDVDESL